MSPPRKFNHDDARARHAAGETIAALARRYRVSWAAVARVVDPDTRAIMDERSRAYTMRGTCEGCGKTGITSARFRQAPSYSGNATRTLCRACASRAKRKKLRLTTEGVLSLECGSCKQAKPLDQYPPRVRRRLMAGAAIHKTTCRECDTAKRRAYRERRKVPCRSCGAPCLPLSEKGKHATDSRLCRPCWFKLEAPAKLWRAA